MADHGTVVLLSRRPLLVVSDSYSVPVTLPIAYGAEVTGILPRRAGLIGPTGTYLFAGTGTCPPPPEPPMWGQLWPRSAV